MTDQPEALRLADRLEGRWALHPEMQQAAAELRRQHDEIEKLRGEVARLTELHTLYQDKTERLKAERDALQNTKHYEAPRGFVLNPDYLVPELQAERDAAVKVLKWLDRWLGHKPMPECTAKIKAAIDAARGEKNG